MSRRMTRRRLLSETGKTTLALAALKSLAAGGTQTFASVAATPSPQTGAAVRFGRAFARLDEFIAEHMRSLGVPGMTVALSNRQGLLRASAHGLADLKTGARVLPSTLFEIGSISKSFVATALLQLRDEGKFDLHKPLSAYLPWLKISTRYAPITGHHLLSHTSGLPEGTPLTPRGPYAQLWTGYAPGEHFSYSNLGYQILGLLLEELDGRAMSVSLRERLFKPLGMSRSEPVITNDIRERLAVGYGPFYDDRPFPRRGRLAEAAWMEFGEGAGSIAATAPDMGDYLRFLLNRGNGPRGRVLSEDGFRLLIQPAVKAPFWGEDASYGYGLWVNEAEGRTLLRHTGGMVAFSSAMHVDITSGFGVFASANANLNGYRPNVVAQYALNLLRAAANGRELPALPAPEPAPDRVANASDYAGTYKSPDGHLLTVEQRGERLFLPVAGQLVALERAGKDQFIVRHPDFELFTLGFGREKEKVVELFHGARWYTNERYTGPRAFEYPKAWEAFAGHYRNDSPWYGSLRVVLRKGRLWVEGAQPLAHVEANIFRPADEDHSPERFSFDSLMDDKAMRLNVSGVDFYRTFTP